MKGSRERAVGESLSTSPKNSKKAELLLRKLLYEHPELAERFGWSSERARWAELAYLLSSKLVSEDNHFMRQAIGTASALGMLEVTDLASDPPDEEHGANLMLLFSEHNLSEAETKAVVGTLREAAKHIQELLGGHLHKFLRHHAELMLHELTSQFKLKHVDEWHAQQAFVMWLQNTCNLPLSLQDAGTKAFCAAHRITEKELVEAADAIQLNLAVVDDLVALEHTRELIQEASNG
jgi:hypothetical protein